MGENEAVTEAFVRGRCRVCRDVTRHAVLSVCDQKPKTVQCSRCNDEHKYKSPPPTRAEKERIAAARLRAKMQKEDREEWARMRPNMVTAKAKDYSMDGLFRKKDIVRHPLFGLGVVERKTGHRKVEILFADGRKVMRCQ